MNAVIYISFSGQSKTVAERLSKQLDFPLLTFGEATGVYDSAVVVFPVHCQGAPEAVKDFLKNLNAEHVALIATYGSANPGNAIYEAAKVCGKIVAAAYIPAKHTYNERSYRIPEVPQSVIEKILNPAYIKIPKRFKTPFAGVLQNARSRAIIKIKKSDACVSCNACAGVCPAGAINCGKINCKCIRCLSCVSRCPHGALTAKKSLLLKLYLKKPRCEKVLIYV